MRLPITIIPDKIIAQYNLLPLIHRNCVYMEIRKGIYGLPQAGILANQLLAKRLALHGYTQTPHTSGLWKPHSPPIAFSLVVDDFGVKYVGKQHANHLFNALKEHYKAATDWDGGLYCGVKLDWNYDERTVDLSMLGYVAAALHKFQYPNPKQPYHSPLQWNIPAYGAKVHLIPARSKAQSKNLQQVVGTFLFYARAVDSTMLHTLNALSAAQSRGTQAIAKALVHLLCNMRLSKKRR
jgi:hypothetical protein